MDLSVAIPSCARAEKLARLLDSLGHQTLSPNRFEVLVGFDGKACPVSNPNVRVLTLDKNGPASTRNAIIDEAKGNLLLLLNDDVVASPDLLEQHLISHSEPDLSGGMDLVLGSAPWVVPEGDTLFDRMIRETSMVFFYNTMNDSAKNRDWGFRHAWTLNLSIRTELAREVRFDAGLTRAMFEDLEWAWRLADQKSSRVVYRPKACVEHDHRHTPAGYLERERALGAQALELARINPACAHDIFHCDIANKEYVRSCIESVELSRERCVDLERDFLSLTQQTPESCADIQVLYDMFRPLKNLHWHHGLIEASAARDGVVA